MNRLLITLTALSFILTGCVSDQQVASKVKEALEKDPTIITNLIKKNPAEFITAFQDAAQNAKAELAKKREEEERQAFDKSFDNPIKPMIRKDNVFRGAANAPLVLVEYSDFQCPFCTRGYETVEKLMKKYNGKIKFIYKHLPLSFHKEAMPASQYFEAIAIESPAKAFEFHDELFKNQRKVSKGVPFFDQIAKKVGADMTQLKKNLESKRVKDRIAEDMKEAAKFGMQGTPGFLLNGIPVKGAFPVEHFEKIINKLKSRGLKM